MCLFKKNKKLSGNVNNINVDKLTACKQKISMQIRAIFFCILDSEE